METAGIRQFLVLLSTVKLLDGSTLDVIQVAPEGPLKVQVGATVQFNCSVNTQIIPPETMVWDYNKNLEPKVTIRRLGMNLLQLKVSNVALGDSGSMTCKAENQLRVPQFKQVNLYVLADPETSCTGLMQYKCTSGECIFLPFRCDNVKHCEDSSDEIGCHPTCPIGYLCKNEKCIGARFVCDRYNENNCGDWSDESNCMNRGGDPPFVGTEEDEMDWLRTTVYTAVGCIIAMVLIIAILIVSILRIRMKREQARLAQLDQAQIQTIGSIGPISTGTIGTLETSSPYAQRCPPSTDTGIGISDTFESEATVHMDSSSLIEAPPPYVEQDPHLPDDDEAPPPYETMDDRRTGRRQRSGDRSRTTQRKERRHHSPRISPRSSPRPDPQSGTPVSSPYVPMLYEVSL